MNNMKYGMSSLAELATLQEQVELCAELGLQFVELNMNLPEYAPERLSEIDFAAYADRGVCFNLHAPEDMDLGSFHAPVRSGWQEYLLQVAETLPMGAVDILNIHLCDGVHFKLPDRKLWLYDKYFEDYFSGIANTLTSVLPLLRKKRIRLCLENTGNFQLSHIRRTLDTLLLDENIGLTWDIGHDYCASWSDSSVFETYLDKIRHFHIHDAQGEKCHLELYSGEIDLHKYFSLQEQLGCSAVIEVKSAAALRNSIRSLRKTK